MGVIRQELRFDPAGDEDADTEVVGTLILRVEDPAPGEAPITGAVIYTLGLDRLRDLLVMAAAGHEVDGLILSLDAVALASDGNDADG